MILFESGILSSSSTEASAKGAIVKNEKNISSTQIDMYSTSSHDPFIPENFLFYWLNLLNSES
jgi:hypothetical protein